MRQRFMFARGSNVVATSSSAHVYRVVESKYLLVRGGVVVLCYGVLHLPNSGFPIVQQLMHMLLRP